MRFAITVRGDGIDLRGYADNVDLKALTAAMEPFGLVESTLAHRAYDPFADPEDHFGLWQNTPDGERSDG